MVASPTVFKNIGRAGFTLVELSIVLVIIGLIIGGVLVGRTLIEASQLRAQVTQFERFNQAVNTFRDKYGCLPGDCANATDFFSASAIGVSASMGTNGNGNGVLDDWNSGNNPNTTGFPFSVAIEPEFFWSELFAAGLVECCNGAKFASQLGTVSIGTTVPQDKINGFGISVGNLGSRNGYFWGITTSTGVAGWSDVCGGEARFYCNLSITGAGAGVISPAQASAFDTKVDDGNPATGNVYAAFMWASGDNYVHPQSGNYNGNCLTSPTVYAISYGSPACSLWINMQGGE